MNDKLKRRIFLTVAFAALIAEFVWFFLHLGYDQVKGDSNYRSYVVIAVTIHLAYFLGGYLLVFGFCLRRSAAEEKAWSPYRCYTLFLLSVLSFQHQIIIPTGTERFRLACVIIDTFFFGRVLVGRKRNEKNWEWQVYAVLFIWIVPVCLWFLMR